MAYGWKPVRRPQLLAMCKSFANTNALMLSAANPREKSILPLLQAMGKAYMHGAAINWKAVHNTVRPPVDLPSYPFQSKKYWIEKTTCTNGNTRHQGYC